MVMTKDGDGDNVFFINRIMHMVDLASSTSLHSVTIVEPLDLIHLQVLSIDRNSGFDHFRNEKICFSTNRWVGLAETLKIDILTLAHLNIVSNYFEQKRIFKRLKFAFIHVSHMM